MDWTALVKVPVNAVVGFCRWVKEAINTPARIKKLESGLAESRDPRPGCTSCGTGRVGKIRMLPVGEPGWKRPVGTCSNCGMDWRLSDDGSKLDQLYSRHP